MTLPFDLELIAVVLTERRLFDDSLVFDPALACTRAFLTAGFLAGDLALTCLFAMTFFWALTDFDGAFGAVFLKEVFAVVFTAFLMRAFFATFLATFAVEILLCFDTEAFRRPEETGFFFNSFFFFEPIFETDLELVPDDATLGFALPFWRLESVSLIPISFC
ncbi:MAG: hypothetical protein AB7U82_29950 [Blastocatellales bacterium]